MGILKIVMALAIDLSEEALKIPTKNGGTFSANAIAKAKNSKPEKASVKTTVKKESGENLKWAYLRLRFYPIPMVLY